MTNLYERMLSGRRIEPATVPIPGGGASDRASRPGSTFIIIKCLRPVWSEFSLCAQWIAKNLSFLHADSEDADQTGRMPRLIWVSAWRTCQFVGFVVWRLKYINASNNLKRDPSETQPTKFENSWLDWICSWEIMAVIYTQKRNLCTG